MSVISCGSRSICDGRFDHDFYFLPHVPYQGKIRGNWFRGLKFRQRFVDDSVLAGCYGRQQATQHISSSSVVGSSCKNKLLLFESNLVILSTCFRLEFPYFRHALQHCVLFSQLRAFCCPSGIFMKFSHHSEPTEANIQFYNLVYQEPSYTWTFSLDFEADLSAMKLC
jgi:hypothetical protein